MNDLRLLRHPRFEGQIVRPALKQEHPTACAGFSLGRLCLEDATVQFDFALVVLGFQHLDGLDGIGVVDLREWFPAAGEVASLFGRQVIGLWAAWTRAGQADDENRAKRDSWLAGEAAALGLPFVSVTPIDGLSRWRRTWFSKTEDFPEKASRAIRVKGRPCNGPFDNPRRVRAEWRARRRILQD